MTTLAHVHIRCVKPAMVRRYAAYAFDWTLVGLAVELVPTQSLLIGVASLIVLGCAYFSLMEASSYQGTIGKFLVGLRVEDERGGRLEIHQALARFFAGALSWATLNIGHMMAMWRPDGRALHDMVAKTRVCQERNLETRHHVAVAVLLAVHVISLIVATVLAVQEAMEQLNASGLIQTM